MEQLKMLGVEIEKMLRENDRLKAKVAELEVLNKSLEEIVDYANEPTGSYRKSKGKISINLSPALHNKLNAFSERVGLSKEDFALQIIKKSINGWELAN